MVSTRASQASQGSQPTQNSRKRRASSTFSEVGSQASKARKTSGRRFTSANEQLLEEERESLAGSREVSLEAPVATQPQHTPTHSRKASRHSLPANLQLPANIKFEPLRVALAREAERRRRATEGLGMDGALVEYEDEESTTYVDLADLGIDGTRLMTPNSRAPVLIKHTPLSLIKKGEMDLREDDIFKYEMALQKVTMEKAELAGKLQVLQLAVQALGFGDETMLEEDMCSLVRQAFDHLRAEESEMPIEMDWKNITNEDLLKAQPEIVRGLLRDIDQYAGKLEECEAHLALMDAEYKGVLSKLSEREEINKTQAEALQKADNLINAQTAEVESLTEAKVKLEGEIKDYELDVQDLEQELNQNTIQLQKEKEDAVARMTEELNQEHHYRQTAEQEIAEKDAAYTTLQIKYEEATSDLDVTKEQLVQAKKDIDAKDEELEKLEEKLEAQLEEKKELDKAFDRLEANTCDLEEDIKELTERNEQNEKTIKEQGEELDGLANELKDKETEINELKSDVFGAQEDVKQKSGIISKLTKNIEALNKSMEELKKEKDDVIAEKNTHLDEYEGVVDKLHEQIQQKDSDIEALRKENLRVIAANEELRKALATRGKDVRVLRDITNQLVGDAEQDMAAQRDWVARKAELLQQVRRTVDTIGEAPETTTLTQQVEKTTIVKTAVRDSGYLGEEGENADMLLANGDLYE